MALGRGLALVVMGIGLMAAEQASAPSNPTVRAAWPTAHYRKNNDGVVNSDSIIKVRYRRRFPILLNSDTPVVDGRLFVVGGRPLAQGASAAQGYVYALDAKTGRVLWTQTTPNTVYAEPIVSQGRVLIGVGNGHFSTFRGTPSLSTTTIRGTGPGGVYAYKAATGWPLFEFGTPGSDQAASSVVGERIYVASGTRELYVLNLETGQLRWQVNLGHYVSRSSPRIVDGLAVVGGAGPLGVVAVNLHSHRVAWNFPVKDAIGGVDDTTLGVQGHVAVSAAVLGPNRLSRGRFRAIVFAINLHTGHLLWQRQIGTGPLPPFKETGTPLVIDGRVFVGNGLDAEMTALSLRTGAVLWHLNTGSPVTRPPVLYHRRLVWVSSRGRLEEVNVDGKVLFSKSLGHFVNAYGPVILGHTALVTANTPSHGDLIAFPLSAR